MARTRRDYAKKPQPQKAQTPGWVWLLTGLLIGLFIAFLVYLQQSGQSPLGKQRKVQKSEKSVRKPAKTTAPVKKEKSGITLDFYDYLPKMEVVIPEEELETPSGKVIKPATYFLQVGSFRKPEDADSRKAQLGLLGMVSRIEQVEVEGKGTWHRVRLGPFEDRRKVDRTIRQLQENDIDFILLKEKS